ncbi:MAG TPA: phenylalanine--tRNA ligase subunit beta, partial [Nitrosarchaeum sp.]|nr:phenylalanine--tRNA ligase subunit beta [Nitrosarchaeum sp.]
VLDSKSQEHTILRDSILPGLLENLSRNIHTSYPQKLFETGTVFSQGNPIDEKTSFGVISAHQDATFTEIKSILQSALKTGFNIDVDTKTFSHPIFEEGRTASISIHGKIIGIMGEINSKTIENYKIRVPVVGFEISLSGLIFD